MQVLNKPRLLPLFLAAAAAFVALTSGSQSFLRPAGCIPAALSSAAVNSSRAVGSLLECALLCIGSGWCTAMLMRTGLDCSLINSELYYGSWLGQGADCPGGLYEKEAAVEWLPFSSCQQIDVTNDAPCNRSIDGNTDQNFNAGSCAHTDINSINWWRASLPQRAYIDSVALYNRQDCCAQRLNNFTISLDGAVFASYFESSSFSVKNFSCGRVGQTVQLDHHFPDALTLCEVIVYGKRFP